MDGHRHAGHGQPRPHAADRPPTRLGEPSIAPGRVEGVGQPVLSFEQCFILFCNFPLVFAFVVRGLGFVAGWRHALRSEWPFIIIIIIISPLSLFYYSGNQPHLLLQLLTCLTGWRLRRPRY